MIRFLLTVLTIWVTNPPLSRDVKRNNIIIYKQ